MNTGTDTETKRTNMLTHVHTHTVAQILMLSDVHGGVPVWIRIHFCLPSPLNQYPPWWTDSCKCAREAPQVHICTHTHALMPVDVCDGLCCFLINSSHADWSIHLITGCIDGPGSHREGKRQTGLDKDRQSQTQRGRAGGTNGGRDQQTARSTDGRNGLKCKDVKKGKWWTLRLCPLGEAWLLGGRGLSCQRHSSVIESVRIKYFFCICITPPG